MKRYSDAAILTAASTLEHVVIPNEVRDLTLESQIAQCTVADLCFD
jgi:hypothetical protein